MAFTLRSTSDKFKNVGGKTTGDLVKSDDPNFLGSSTRATLQYGDMVLNEAQHDVNGVRNPVYGVSAGVTQLGQLASGIYSDGSLLFPFMMYGEYDSFLLTSVTKRKYQGNWQMWRIKFGFTDPTDGAANPFTEEIVEIVGPGEAVGTGQQAWEVDGTDTFVFVSGSLPASIRPSDVKNVNAMAFTIEIFYKNLITLSTTSQSFSVDRKANYGVLNFQLQMFKS